MRRIRWTMAGVAVVLVVSVAVPRGQTAREDDTLHVRATTLSLGMSLIDAQRAVMNSSGCKLLPDPSKEPDATNFMVACQGTGKRFELPASFWLTGGKVTQIRRNWYAETLDELGSAIYGAVRSVTQDRQAVCVVDTFTSEQPGFAQQSVRMVCGRRGVNITYATAKEAVSNPVGVSESLTSEEHQHSGEERNQ